MIMPSDGVIVLMVSITMRNIKRIIRHRKCTTVGV